MKDREKLINVLQGLYSYRFADCFDIYTTELVNTGKISVSNLQILMTSPERLSESETFILVWLYKSLQKYESFKLPNPRAYFTENEEISAELTVVKRVNGKLPLTFDILAKLTDNDNYLICLSIQQIAEMKESGIIRWEEGMQRESVITKLSENEFVSHVKFDDNRARAIGDSMNNGTFYPNALRWHIVSGMCDYEVTEKSVILKKGFIAEIDGQHRDKGSEYALRKNPDMLMNMPIILTIGTPALAQHIINQDEERAPIDKDVVAMYKSTSGVSILKLITGSEELDPVYKFCDTEQGIRTGSGFVLKSTVSEAINKHYCESKMSRKSEQLIAKWLVDFFNSLADEMYSDFSDYKKSKKENRKAAFQVFEGYVIISRYLYGKPDWQEQLSEILKRIDFTKTSVDVIKQIKNITKEV